jgi:hypothetical protein
MKELKDNANSTHMQILVWQEPIFLHGNLPVRHVKYHLLATNEYESMKDVPVVSAATAWTNEDSGETFILLFHQVLWYGSKLPHSLLNPNQIRHFGHAVCDDVTDKARFFGIETEDVSIPFTMKGTNIFFKTRVPTTWEMDNCRTIVMTDDAIWEPDNVSIAQILSDRDSYSDKLYSISDVFSDIRLTSKMVSAVQVHTIKREPLTNSSLLEKRTDTNHENQTANMINKNISYLIAKNRHSHITAEEVAKRFRCGLETARRTLKATTQNGIRHAIHPLTRRYRVDHLNLNRRRLNDTFYTDTLFSRVKSLKGFTCAQVYTNGRYTRVFPMALKSSENIAQTLRDFVDDVGIPNTLVCDLATEQVGSYTPMMREVRHYRIRMHNAEKGHSSQNHKAETEIRELKARWKTCMTERQVPKCLWDYGLVYISEILSIIARQSTGQPGMEEIKGQTIDISEWLDFLFYDLVWYWNEEKTDMTEDQRLLGHWLGIAHRIGSDMTYWILTESGQVIARSTVQHVTITDLQKPTIQTKVKEFEEAVKVQLSENNFMIKEPGLFYLDDDEEQIDGVVPTDDEYGDMIQESMPDVNEVEIYDKYLNAEFVINHGDEPVRIRVHKQARTENGNVIGQAHKNPMFDTREYECILDDGTIERYSANIIAENLYSQCDDEGHSFVLLAEIIDHKKDASAISIADGFTTSHNGN